MSINIQYRSIKTGIKNLIFYFKVIWNDRFWDSYFIYILLDKKLQQMENNWCVNTYAEGDEETKKIIISLRQKIKSIIEYDNYDDYKKEQKLKRKFFLELYKNMDRLWD